VLTNAADPTRSQNVPSGPPHAAWGALHTAAQLDKQADDTKGHNWVTAEPHCVITDPLFQELQSGKPLPSSLIPS